MSRICLVGPHHASNNPRLIREAIALSNAGHEVVAITLRFDPRWVALEESVLKNANWRHVAVDFLCGPNAKARWLRARVRRRIGSQVASRCLNSFFVNRALVYGFPELLKAALKVRADFYIAHAHPALPVAALAAKKHRVPFAFDAEDLLAESPAEPVGLHRSVEQRFLRDCSYISTMSEAAADYYRCMHRGDKEPVVLHNAFSFDSRNGIAHPSTRRIRDYFSVYWFGQTIGPASRADQLLRALPHIPHPVKISLRGNPHSTFVPYLRELAASLNLSDRLEILPVGDPNDLVRLAADHDILFGAQPGQEQYYQRAIGNKVMGGIMAGLAVLLTNTIAHRQLLQTYGGFGELFADNDERDLARVIDRWLKTPDKLRAMQIHSWKTGETALNWESESRRLVSAVDQALQSRKAFENL